MEVTSEEVASEEDVSEEDGACEDVSFEELVASGDCLTELEASEEATLLEAGALEDALLLQEPRAIAIAPSARVNNSLLECFMVILL